MLVPRSFPKLSILLLAAICVGPTVGPAEAAPRVHLGTAYLVEPLGTTHQVRLDGELGGRAKLTLDGNTCTLNAFGDPGICTEMAFPAIDVAVRQLEMADPAGARRRLFRIEGEGMPKGQTWTLVVPRRRSGVHRLVVDLGNERRRVVTLEALPKPKAVKPPAELSKGTYEALRAGSKVVLTARGQNPTPGYENFFEYVKADSSKPGNAPHFRLLRRRPAGMAATVMTDFETKFEFEATPSIEEVVVHDRGGRHVVPIRAAGDK